MSKYSEYRYSFSTPSHPSLNSELKCWSPNPTEAALEWACDRCHDLWTPHSTAPLTVRVHSFELGRTYQVVLYRELQPMVEVLQTAVEVPSDDYPSAY